MKIKILFFLWMALFTAQWTYAQNITEAAARAELEKRGYDADRFKAEMIKKGVNPDAINPDNPADVARAKKAAEEVMAMLDAEKRNGTTQPSSTTTGKTTTPESKPDDIRSVDKLENISPQATEIQKAVKDGATIEEAVAEKIQENAKNKLPRADTYGQHIFRDKSLKLFRTSEDAKPTKSYVLGPGDKVAISIWGPTRENFAVEIEKDGYIQPTNMPRFYIGGLTIAKAEELLASRMRNYYYFQKENFELTVTTARTLNVNIVGEVFTNGTFNISAVNTAFNALVAAGGPTDLGSVRKIQLLRAGKKPVTIDVYQYLQNPVISQDYYLAENDFINVPVADKKITIQGAVNRPFKYELIENETLTDLIRYAGGLTADALKSNIQVRRIESDSIRIIDVNLYELEKNKSLFKLYNGDVVTINVINTLIKNEASISGAVENPGKYAITQNDKLSDLINKGKLLDHAITDIAYLKRYNDDYKTIRYEFVNIHNILSDPSSTANLELQRGDELIISSKADFSDTYTVKVNGAVRKPVNFALDNGKNLKVSDALFFAGGPREDAMQAFAFIFRKKEADVKSYEYISFNLKNVLEHPGSADDISLEPGDSLMIYSRNNYADQSFIHVDGAVRKPGDFIYSPSLTFKDVLLLAGGLRQEAALDKIDIYRLDFSNNNATQVLAAKLSVDENLNLKNAGGNFQLQPFDQIFVRTAPKFELQRNIKVMGEVNYPGTYALLGQNTKIESIIKEAGGTTEEAFLKGATLKRTKDNLGYVIIDLQKAIKDPRSFDNIILQEGDEIYIPKINNIVTISGATKASELYRKELLMQGKIHAPYRKGERADYYIDQYAGGLAKNAARNKISVIDASGKITKAKNFLFFKTYPKVGPGSEIVVGYKDVKVKQDKEKEKEDVKWGDILANSIAQATAILSLILLIQNVN